MQVKACFNEKSVEGNPKMQMNFWIAADSKSQWKDYTNVSCLQETSQKVAKLFGVDLISCTHNRHWCPGLVGQDLKGKTN